VKRYEYKYLLHYAKPSQFPIVTKVPNLYSPSFPLTSPQGFTILVAAVDFGICRLSQQVFSGRPLRRPTEKVHKDCHHVQKKKGSFPFCNSAEHWFAVSAHLVEWRTAMPIQEQWTARTDTRDQKLEGVAFDEGAFAPLILMRPN
jgi:hypothetical protein